MVFSCGKIIYSAYNCKLHFWYFFFLQLYSLNDYKPPISKAKMTQITKAAIKAIKVWNLLTSFDLFYISHYVKIILWNSLKNLLQNFPPLLCVWFPSYNHMWYPGMQQKAKNVVWLSFAGCHMWERIIPIWLCLNFVRSERQGFFFS